jgi:hypothetical protein
LRATLWEGSELAGLFAGLISLRAGPGSELIRLSVDPRGLIWGYLEHRCLSMVDGAEADVKNIYG